MTTSTNRVAVVLAGCGRSDGSEIHESVSVLTHLNRHGFAYQCFAPDKPQAEVVNHLTGKTESGQVRNQMVEAARIARGEIKPLSALSASDFDAIAFPGGFGAAKNLCTFAKDGANCTIDADVVRVIRAFHAAGKPIGLACIAPVIAAKVLGTGGGGPGCEVTIGSDAATATAIEAMGAKNIVKDVTQAHVDAKNRIVTTPAYMCDTGPWGVYQGVGVMIDQLAAMLAK